MLDPYNLGRFIEAQNPIYDCVLSELRRGQKKSHWMWFILPQLGGLGHSEFAVRFSISGRDEARAYLQHSILGPRLRECTTMVLRAETKAIAEIFSSPDDLKFRSSMTLFDFVKPGTVFGQALSKFFDGRGDQTTLSALKA
jgi:uncharacterized protein (DUF1810 family)